MDRDIAHALAEFAEQSGRGLDGLDRKALFARLEERHRELLAAIAWFLEERQPDGAMRIANALARFWTATARLEEGSQWFGNILAAANGSEAYFGRACFEAGLVEFWRGDDDRASALHRRALEVGRRSGDATISALALTGLARIALRSNQLDDAQQLCREALTASQGEGSPLGRANALHVLGVAAQMAGNLSDAREFMGERMVLARELGQYGGIASEAANLAMVEHQLGDLNRAEALVPLTPRYFACARGRPQAWPSARPVRDSWIANAMVGSTQPSWPHSAGSSYPVPPLAAIAAKGDDGARMCVAGLSPQGKVASGEAWLLVSGLIGEGSRAAGSDITEVQFQLVTSAESWCANTSNGGMRSDEATRIDVRTGLGAARNVIGRARRRQSARHLQDHDPQWPWHSPRVRHHVENHLHAAARRTRPGQADS